MAGCKCPRFATEQSKRSRPECITNQSHRVPHHRERPAPSLLGDPVAPTPQALLSVCCRRVDFRVKYEVAVVRSNRDSRNIHPLVQLALFLPTVSPFPFFYVFLFLWAGRIPGGTAIRRTRVHRALHGKRPGLYLRRRRVCPFFFFFFF